MYANVRVSSATQISMFRTGWFDRADSTRIRNVLAVLACVQGPRKHSTQHCNVHLVYPRISGCPHCRKSGAGCLGENDSVWCVSIVLAAGVHAE